MKDLSSVFPHLLQSFGQDDERALLFLEELWGQIVGAELSRHTRPVSIQGQTLLLGVRDKVWETQLAGMKGLLQDAVNNFWGCRRINHIQLTVRAIDRSDS